MVNKWGQLNMRMQDVDTSEDVITIIPQEEAIIFELNAYFSTLSSVREDTLKADKYRSSRLNILGVNDFLLSLLVPASPSHSFIYFRPRNLPMPL